MSLVLHISDPHFGTERQAVVEALVALEAAQQPDVVMLSGDITQRARRGQFEAAARFMARLSAPAKVSNSVNVVRYRAVARQRECEGQRWDCLDEAGAFVRVHRIVLMHGADVASVAA